MSGKELLISCRLDRHTQDVMEKGLEESLGDEGYAAWLQYREIQRVKRDRETAAKATSGKEEKSQWVIVDKGTDNYCNVSIGGGGHSKG